MKNIVRIAVVAAALALVLVPEATYAQAGRMHRATRRRTAVVVGSAASASGSAKAAEAQQQTAAAQQQSAASQQEAAAAKQQAAAAEQEAAAAKQEAAAAKQGSRCRRAPPKGVLPLGSVVPTLPAGCVSTTAGGVEYQHCGGNYYRAVFQGSNLVYVTAQP